MIKYTTGDIFDSDAKILVNPVNCVGVSGAGLALQFAKRYPGGDRWYKQVVREYGGEMPLTANVSMHAHDGVEIYYFPTKIHWVYSSTYAIITNSLKSFRRYLEISNDTTVLSVAMPKVGCGLGGLYWHIVKPIIEEELGMLPNKIEVYE